MYNPQPIHNHISITNTRYARSLRAATQPKMFIGSRLLKTGFNKVGLLTLLLVVNNIVQHCWVRISPQSGVTMWAAQHCNLQFALVINVIKISNYA